MLHVSAGTETVEAETAVDREPRARVLVVDDDRSAVAVLSRALEAHGFAVSEARSVPDARAQLSQAAFDIVLLDLILPGESGQVLLDELAPLRPRTVVVVLTGVQGMHVATDAFRRGAYDYIRKPFSRDNLILALERCLHHRQTEIRSHEAEQQLREAVALHAAQLANSRASSDRSETALLRATSGIAEARGADGNSDGQFPLLE
jgi:DNA-binding NtrC family response regulator